MSCRLQIVLPGPVAAQLEDLARAAGEPRATLAARLIRDGLALSSGEGKRAPSRPSPPVADDPDRRPAWLPPYGSDPAWWREMWGQVLALHGRYPRHLEHLKDGWWEDEAQTETLCALAVWRAEIDEQGHDPREELSFHHQLAHLQHDLRQQAGGVADTWTPGAPPER